MLILTVDWFFEIRMWLSGNFIGVLFVGILMVILFVFILIFVFLVGDFSVRVNVLLFFGICGIKCYGLLIFFVLE